MRFTCPKCGKKYASSAEPAPGKAYRLKCKACGEPIVLRAGGVVSTAPTPAPGTVAAVGRSPTPPPVARARAAPPPPVAPPPAPAPSASGTSSVPAPASAELPAADSTPAPTPPPGPEISIPSGTPTPGALATPPPAPASADAALSLDQLLGDTGPSPTGPVGANDPFAAAARASLPDGYGAGGAAPDPIAALTRDPAAPPRREATPPSFASIPKPPRQRSGATVVLLVGGLVALLAVLAFALLRDGGVRPADPKPPPAASRPAAP